MKIFAHSMGNVVVGSAIKRGMHVGRYVMQHAAMAAQAYDGQNAALLHPSLQNSPTPDTEGLNDPFKLNTVLGLNDQFGVTVFSPGGRKIRVVNFSLQGDTALMAWVDNQLLNKPSTINNMGWYQYDRNWVEPGRNYAQNSIHLIYDLLSRQPDSESRRAVRDLNEAMAYVSASRTFPAGARADVSGSVDDNLDLDSYFQFGADHSAEWNRKSQRTFFYWERLAYELRLIDLNN